MRIEVKFIREHGRRRRRTWSVLFLAVVLLAAMVGVALGSIPDSVGVFHGCVDSTGKLRLVDPSVGQVCKSSQTAVSWPSNGMTWQGVWSASTSYKPNDVVSYGGQAWVANLPGSGVVPGAPLSGKPRLRGVKPWDPVSGPPRAAAGPSLPSVGLTRFNGVGLGSPPSTVQDIHLAPGRYFLVVDAQLWTLDGSEQIAECSLQVGYGASVTADLDDTHQVPIVAASRNGQVHPAYVALQGAVYYTQPGFARVTCHLYRGYTSGTISALQVSSIYTP